MKNMNLKPEIVKGSFETLEVNKDENFQYSYVPERIIAESARPEQANEFEERPVETASKGINIRIEYACEKRKRVDPSTGQAESAEHEPDFREVPGS